MSIDICRNGAGEPELPLALPALTPMEMLGRAVANGADIAVLERLMELQERWRAHQARRAFDEAIAAAKSEIAPITRNATAHNNKRYADFAAIARAVDPALSKNGLSYRFRTVQDDKIKVTCILSHKDGHCEENTLSGPADATGNKNAIQAIGSTLTYLQRYSLIQALGLAASNDDDGHAAATGNGAVSDEQAAEISRLVTETKSNIDLFLKWAGAASIPDISAAKYEAIVKALNAKMKGRT